MSRKKRMVRTTMRVTIVKGFEVVEACVEDALDAAYDLATQDFDSGNLEGWELTLDDIEIETEIA